MSHALPGGRFVISLDFELHWGVRDHSPVEAYRANLDGVRRAVPAMLELFRTRQIHATWATVGFLCAETREELLRHAPMERPRYADARLDPYGRLADEVGAGEGEDPYHFAASLIRQILATPHQELASHTFSHYYCLEAGQDASTFAADLSAATRIAREKWGVALGSLVFPRNQVNARYLPIVREAGLRAYRGSPTSWLYDPCTEAEQSPARRAARLLDAYLPLSGDNSYAPPRREAGLVDVRASRFLRPYSRLLAPFEPLRLRRIERDLVRAARRGRVYHLWWHPHNFGVHLDENLAALGRVLARVDELKRQYGLRSVNMGELADEVGGREAPEIRARAGSAA